MRPRSLRAVVLAAALALCGACQSGGTASEEAAGAALDGSFVLTIEGNTTWDDGDLRGRIQPSLQEFVSSGFRKFAADDAAYSLQSHYRDEGFPSVRVDYEVLAPAADQPAQLRLTVVEGKRCELAEVEFAGNAAIGDDVLRGLVSGPWYVASRVAAARDAIADLYYERGHLLIEVDAPAIELIDGDTRARVRYTLREGPGYRLQSVAFEGLPESWSAALSEAVAARVGTPWFPRVGFELSAAVRELCANRGRPDATVQVKETRADSGAVDLLIKVDTGPEVRVGAVLVSGNERTRDRFILARVGLEPGSVYDRRQERNSFRDLYATGLFRRVSVRLADDGGSERDVHVVVEELPSLEVYVEPGWGSYEGARLKFGVRENNLFGQGRVLRAETTGSFLAQRGELGFTDPWLFGPELVLDVSTFAGRREEPSFTRNEIGAVTRLLRRWSRRFETTFAYEWRDSRASDIQVDDPDLAAEERVSLSLFSVSPVYDSRDAPFLPRGGTLARFEVQVSDKTIGSELDYVRTTAGYAHYWPLGERTVLATNARTGFLIDTGDTQEFPLTLRFFNGGENSVRSFNESQLGPVDAQNQPIGGEAFSTLSVELRRDLRANFQAALFVDVGNVVARVEDYGTFRDMRAAVGVGLRWLLPIGPIRVDLGVNPDPRDGEEDFVVHVSVGIAF